MNKQRLAISIISGLGILATFLPWVSLPIVGSVSGTNGDGWIVLVLFIIPFAVSLLNDKTKPLSGRLFYIGIVSGFLAGLFGIWKIIAFKSKMAEMSSGMQNNPFAKLMEASVSLEFGIFLVVLAGIALPIVTFLIKDKKAS